MRNGARGVTAWQVLFLCAGILVIFDDVKPIYIQAFVKDNDLYISVDLTEERRLTFDGTADVFNGVPDWIYEGQFLAME